MLIRFTSYTASSGPVEHSFDYLCARCGARAPATVRTVGTSTSTAVYGAGGSAAAARDGAAQAAQANAAQAIGCAACPHCRSLPPRIVAQVEGARAAVERDRRQRLPAAVIGAGIASVLGGIGAAIDFRESSALAFASLAFAIFVGAFVFCAHARTRPLPALFPAGEVWFWWKTSPAAAPAWVRAPSPAALPPPVRMPAVGAVVSGVLMFVSLVGCIAALLVWRTTFLDVYVVDVGGTSVASVSADGRAQPSTNRSATNDVSYTHFRVRRGRTHAVVITDKAGTPRTFTLDDARDGKKGWVVAPDARRNDLCIVDQELVFASSSYAKDPDSRLLNKARSSGPVLPISSSFEYVFEPTPKSISTKESEVRKRALRAYLCSELSKDNLVAYRDRKPTIL